MNVVVMNKAIIQCAVLPEFEGLRQAFRAQKIEHTDDYSFFETEAGVVCILGGMGKEKALNAITAAQSRWHARLLIDFGIAGALITNFAVGDLVIAIEVASAEGGHFTVDDRFIEMAPRYPEIKVEQGTRLTSGLITCEEIDVIHEDVRKNVNSQTGAIAVTWETAILAEFALKHHMSFGSFRMISDVNEQDIKHLRSPKMLRMISSAATVMKKLLQF